MKRTFTRWAMFDGRMLTFQFEYWPPYPATRYQPEEAAEINIISIHDDAGNSIIVPDNIDDGGNGTFEKMVDVLLDIIVKENEDAVLVCSDERGD